MQKSRSRKTATSRKFVGQKKRDFNGSKVERALSEGNRTRDRQGVCYQKPDGDPASGKGCDQYGHGRGDRQRQDIGYRRRRVAGDHRSETGYYESKKIDRLVQAAAGDAHRRNGHAARRSHVRVSGSPGLSG